GGVRLGAGGVKGRYGRLGLGLAPEFAGGAAPDIKTAALWVDRQMSVRVADGDAKYALFGQHLRAIGARHRFALVWRHLVGALRRHRPAGAQRADDMRHPPDAVLVGHQDFVAPECQAIRPVEVLDVAIDPDGMA